MAKQNKAEARRLQHFTHHLVHQPCLQVGRGGVGHGSFRGRTARALLTRGQDVEANASGHPVAHGALGLVPPPTLRHGRRSWYFGTKLNLALSLICQGVADRRSNLHVAAG